jgi:hypothetical protein
VKTLHCYFYISHNARKSPCISIVLPEWGLLYREPIRNILIQRKYSDVVLTAKYIHPILVFIAKLLHAFRPVEQLVIHISHKEILDIIESKNTLPDLKNDDLYGSIQDFAIATNVDVNVEYIRKAGNFAKRPMDKIPFAATSLFSRQEIEQLIQGLQLL